MNICFEKSKLGLIMAPMDAIPIHISNARTTADALGRPRRVHAHFGDAICPGTARTNAFSAGNSARTGHNPLKKLISGKENHFDFLQ
jgi:hypothetical protein